MRGPAPSASRAAHLLALLAVASILVAAAVWWVLDARRNMGTGIAMHDIYGAHYPNMLYALRALRQGYGLLWNPLQNCGQPFLPSTLVGLFFPTNALFLVLSPETAYLLAAGIAQLVGGAGLYLLCRSYGLSAAAALAGALAFQLSANVLALSRWLPVTIAGPYVLTPWALLCGERLIRTAGARAAAGLAVVLALQALGGYPQLLLFTCQLLALRLGWSWLMRESPAPLCTAGLFAVALAASFCLAAVQWLPAMEFARLSLRSVGLSRDEIVLTFTPNWTTFRDMVLERNTWYGTAVTAVGATLALLGLADARLRRTAAFYLLAAALFLALMFDTPVQRLYLATPVGTAFREPFRFIWPFGLCAAVLAAVGVAAIQGHVTGERRPRAAGMLGLALVGLGGFVALGGGLPPAWELALALAVVLLAAGTAVTRSRWTARALAALLPLLVLANVLPLARSISTYADGNQLFYRRQALWSRLAAQMTLADRLYPVASHIDYSLMGKIATIWGLRSISDYEPQTSRRYAGLEVMLLTNAPMRSVNQHYFRLTRTPRNRRILDLLATRWLVVDPQHGALPPAMQATMRPAFTTDGVEVTENPAAVPRAHWVPAARVIPDADALLRELAHGSVDPRRQVLLEAPPADGFLGADAAAPGEARVVADRAEVVTVEVRAPAEGFLVLTDQDYPGWAATVDGAPAPIARANYAFRAVRVPAGASAVVFTYRPRSVYAGAALSLASVLVLAAYLVAGHLVASRRRAG